MTNAITQISLKPATLRRLQRRFAELSGIRLADSKEPLMVARLRSRLSALDLRDFDAYSAYLEESGDAQEQQQFVDLLTTNETYFFREPQHFRFLREWALRLLAKPRGVRVWSAASSSGEEAYSLAMTLLDVLPCELFEVVGTDISARMLARARRGVFGLQRLDHVPPGYLQRFCLRGKDDHEGSLRVSRALRSKVAFQQHNLMNSAVALGRFDVVFLRNVLIYFEREEREQILAHVSRVLQPEGLLVLGSSESLSGVSAPFERVQSSIYRGAT